MPPCTYGIGAVISHKFPEGTKRPVAYASRTLTATERNYFQLEKEALALVYDVQKFHQYLYGRQFVLVTDHKPLTTILGHKHGVPSLAAGQLQRWALILSAYSSVIEFRPTKQRDLQMLMDFPVMRLLLTALLWMLPLDKS